MHLKEKEAMSRIDVFYGRTDGTPGYKEYSCVVVRTAETGQLRYYGDLYEPMAGCNYKVLYEVDMNKLHSLCSKAGVEIPNSPQWIRSPLKDLVLEEWRKHESNRNSNRPGGVSNPMFVGVRF